MLDLMFDWLSCILLLFPTRSEFEEKKIVLIFFIVQNKYFC